MFKIEKMNWHSKEALEAEVYISDGMYEFLFFAHPFHGKQGQIINSEFGALNSSNIYRIDSDKFRIEKLQDFFAYRIGGKVICMKECIIQIGSFHIKLDDYLPGDLVEGEYISFECDRLDLSFNTQNV